MAAEDVVNGTNGNVHHEDSASPTGLDRQSVLLYVRSALQLTLSATTEELERDGGPLAQDEADRTFETFQTFLLSSRPVLYAQKLKTVSSSDQNGVRTQTTFTLSSNLNLAADNVGAVAIIKGARPINISQDISSQLQIISLPSTLRSGGSRLGGRGEASQFGVLYSAVNSALSPYFEAIAQDFDQAGQGQSRTDNTQRAVIPDTKRKLAELELSLLQLQHNVEIPQVNLPLHPEIERVLQQATLLGEKPSADAIPHTTFADSKFIIELQNVVNDWVKSIRATAAADRDPTIGTATQEINFWLDLEDILDDLSGRLQTDGVLLTVEALRRGGRAVAAANLTQTQDDLLKAAISRTQAYNGLLRPLPLHALLSTVSLEGICDALNLIFEHVNKVFPKNPYPTKRAVHLLEAISIDLDMRVRSLLKGGKLIHMDADAFAGILEATQGIWRIWNSKVRKFGEVSREHRIAFKEDDKGFGAKIASHHERTRERLDYVSSFRTAHEQLVITAGNVLGTNEQSNGSASGAQRQNDLAGFDAVKDIKLAYASIGEIDVLDISPEGTRAWRDAENLYNERIARVENTIIAILRDRLDVAKSANAMFQVCSRFNALFMRPKIRSAVVEYQTRLLDRVKQDITLLEQRYNQRYVNTQFQVMAQLHDLPAVSGAVMWAKTIERQLDNYLTKIEDVLGSEWDKHMSGKSLLEDADRFRARLDTQPMFRSWEEDVLERKVSVNGRLFSILKIRGSDEKLQLSVNFDARIVTLFKETRNLRNMGFNIRTHISNASREAREAYPYAITLVETLRIYEQVKWTIDAAGRSAFLLDEVHMQVISYFQQAMPLRWTSFARAAELRSTNGAGPLLHDKLILGLSEAISTLQRKAFIVKSNHELIQESLDRLAECPYTTAHFAEVLATIQDCVNTIGAEEFSQYQSFVRRLNQSIQDILGVRLQQALDVWVHNFSSGRLPSLEHFDDTVLSSTADDGSSEGVDATLDAHHEIKIQNRVIYLDPPLETARVSWTENLQSIISVVCDSSIISISKPSDDKSKKATTDDKPLTCKILLDTKLEQLAIVYDTISRKLVEVNNYVKTWLRFQCLWDLQPEAASAAVGEDLAKWQQLLKDMRATRATFEISDSVKHFGLISIHFEQVLNKVNARYDALQGDLMRTFAEKVSIRTSDVLSALEQARKELEGSSLDVASTLRAVKFITLVQSLRIRAPDWKNEVDTLRESHTMLTRQRFSMSKDWVHIDQVHHEYTAFDELLERHVTMIESQRVTLRAKVEAEDHIVMQRTKDLLAQWSNDKPISGAIEPDHATSVLGSFEARTRALVADAELLETAKQALTMISVRDDSLESLLEEIIDLQAVWAALSTVWLGLNDLRDMSWSNVQPRKLRQSLEKLLQMVKDMPSKMRQYQAFDYLQNYLNQLIKVNPLVADLRGEAIRERHWHRIHKALNPSQRFSPRSMVLGDVWKLQLHTTEKILREIIVQAQGEMSLEEYLRQIKEVWQNYQLELVGYQNKCRLIRGWDDLLTRCSDNINALQAMRHSPYYKEFEEDAAMWEDRLNRLHALFDVWIEVQRHWVYLEAVFNGNADIRHLLPVESSRFQGVNAEFFGLMKKVQRSPLALDVLNIPGVQQSLDRLSEMLVKIQKALGDYLERERASFPRFYFLGDEDLLEIIGNSKDTTRVAKHLGKMFPGISNLLVQPEGVITGIQSPQGEEVILESPITLANDTRVNQWLQELEQKIRASLARLLASAVDDFTAVIDQRNNDDIDLTSYIRKYPAQIAVLAAQVWWTSGVTNSLDSDGYTLANLVEVHSVILRHLAAIVVGDLDIVMRKKCENLITEFVHQLGVIEKLIKHNVTSRDHHLWLLQMRYSYKADGEYANRLKVEMANATFSYGFEYLGVVDRLVRTPLTDTCFLALTQALSQRLGGSPYGPAGTGKTETVKALGLQLGRFVLVFNCDDTFDFQAMGRIFLGICQVGAWGCFDEFNRLDESILSAVSQQIQNIQIGLKESVNDPNVQVDLVGRQFKIDSETGLFITMNPGYAGRSNLPDNLKKLFRSVAMSKPDKELIAEVILYSQGFNQARSLAKQVVPFFDICSKSMSRQPHYDFGLRALKSVLVSCGSLKRGQMRSDPSETAEVQLLLQSLHETICPKLIKEDVAALSSIEQETFPNNTYRAVSLPDLTSALENAAKEQDFTFSDEWATKAIQLYQVQQVNHGIMLVGKAGCGKSGVWKSLLRALQAIDKIESVFHIIEPKVMSKEALYGSIDSTTREWTDGLFTSLLRRILDNMRGESNKRHWVVFDGDVDPEWVENLNSVLDDNKLLTLPNGERLALPQNVRILFEVESLQFATPATVSRCGMVWFDEALVTPTLLIKQNVDRLRSLTFDDTDDDSGYESTEGPVSIDAQASIAEIITSKTSVIERALEAASSLDHVMDFTIHRAVDSLFGLLTKTCRDVSHYRAQHSDFALTSTQLESFLVKRLVIALAWSCTGDSPLLQRQAFANRVADLAGVDLPLLDAESSILDYDVTLPNGSWSAWQAQVPSIDIDTQAITQTDIVVPTLDTVRHESLLYSWLAEHKPLILCGPPGSGKTMTLFSALRKLPNMEVIGLNFSSATSADLLLKSLEQYCDYKKTPNGVQMAPKQLGQWLVVFCDEINLPMPDKYGTQQVISFLRQLIEHGGFWRTRDKTWVIIDRIQFVGACNPPTDVGRHPLTPRFLRHAPLMMVDYPGRVSLRQIYSTFVVAAFKTVPTIRGYASATTEAMIDLYLESQSRFTPAIQPHYVYSPRELTRWVKGIYETIRNLEHLDVNGLVRIWAHEALRLFQDRLVEDEERTWTMEAVKRIASTHFPGLDLEKSLGGSILFSNWLSRRYVPVDRDQLREFVKARLRTFCEEEVDVPLILYDDALDHVLRIDRVFRQPQGHVILIGPSGSGKTTLSRFVAWMNGLKTFQIKVHRKYTAEDFDDDLRGVLRRCGSKGEKICFIMDESNVLDSAFLERMNTLLANAEVPGLFEGDEYAALMTACKDGAQRQGLLLDSQEELYRWFTQQIVKNLHVVFTMNPPEGGLASRAATSPALFNRCVLNWFGDWTDKSLYQVGGELTRSMDLDRNDYVPPEFVPIAYQELDVPPSHRDIIVNAMVHVHQSIYKLNSRLLKQQGRLTYATPRHFLDFVSQYIRLYSAKHEELEEEQRHLNVGLDKLKETVDEVRDLRKSLSASKAELQAKDAQANDQLQKMIVDQRKAEQTKVTALEIARMLARQNDEIDERSRVVQADLARAEPAVLEAQKSVQNIKRQHLTELRSMPTPPGPVKLALEAVCTLLGHKVDNWKAIQAIVRRDDFIATIITYDNEKRMTPAHRARMRNDYLSLEDFSYERVNRASKACGPLVQWVEAQVEYSEILTSVEPLREAVRQLEDQKLDTEAQNIAISRKVAQLEDSIATYKNEYAVLISESQNIKSEMQKLQRKVDRSLHLLESLSSERKRWEDGSKSFETQMQTLVGDTLIAAAFLAYGGLYDQQYRKSMLDDWTQHLSAANIAHKPYNVMSEFLSAADERLQWQQHSLPTDELCTENAIIMKYAKRYPLIIDPTGRTVEFLQKDHAGRRLTVTSFLDENFTKQLESALRFGGSILIQDAEHLDPVLNPVLNREYQRTGGRVLIQLGKQDIDFSTNFKLYLSTRDPSVNFTPDICSRVTFVNFTVTQSSLQSQSLDATLRSERPDVYERRSNLVRMQGDFAVQVRHLEKRLLDALNATQGNILDDDALIDTLETVKNEVGDITAKAAETEGVMSEVEQIMSEYQVIAKSCSAIFSVLEQLKYLNHFYQFSLQYFIGIFEEVLSQVKSSAAASAAHTARVKDIVRSLFVATFQRTSCSILQEDKMSLALLLAQAAPYDLDRQIFDTLIDDDLPMQDGASVPSTSQDQLVANVLSRSVIKDFKFSSHSSEEVADQVLTRSHTDALVVIGQEDSSLSQCLQAVVLTKALRADSLVSAVEGFVSKSFGGGFFASSIDLDALVDRISSSTPIALCCTPGFDASFRVDNITAKRNLRCLNIAMGSNEALSSADKAITDASLSGNWVYLKNVHLALPWLQSLEKRLNGLKPHPDFRLWLSMETTPKIPVNLLRVSAIVMCEQPAGIRANMKDSLATSSDRAQAPPVERARLHLLLALTHAIISERLRYVPSLGWSKKWEFSDADFTFAANVIDTWVAKAAHGRTNIAPNALPWDMLRALTVNTYAGKIDDEGDLQRLQRLVDAIIRVETFEEGFDVIAAVRAVDGDAAGDAVALSSSTSVQKLILPSAPGHAEHRAWIDALPERESPEVLGLPGDAERVLLIEAGKRMLKDVKLVVDKLEEGEVLNL